VPDRSAAASDAPLRRGSVPSGQGAAAAAPAQLQVPAALSLQAQDSAGFHRPGWSTRVLKRALDLGVGVLALMCLAPLMLLIALAIGIGMGGRPILYRQVRPGLNEKAFRIWKFRTMTDQRDAAGNLLPDAQRLTRFGRWLRERSLDELPQLMNILRGDLSLVGPRPLLMRYLPRYTQRQRCRHLVKPGITGWSQVNGRNALDWETRLELDLWYVAHHSLWLDCRILLMTVSRVLRRENVLAGGGSDFAEFWGLAGVPEHGPLALPVEEDESAPPAESAAHAR
jgi:lipopolysaccharide/colanic/teichoic acid biosynthesis glycosyltransferase